MKSRTSVKVLCLVTVSILSLSACEFRKLEGTSVSESYAVSDRAGNKGSIAVITETGAVYCLKGKVKFGNKSLKAGQCFKDSKVYTFSVREFLDKFPKYKQWVEYPAEELK